MTSVSYNDKYIKVYKAGKLVWFKEFYSFDMLMAALEQIKELL